MVSVCEGVVPLRLRWDNAVAKREVVLSGLFRQNEQTKESEGEGLRWDSEAGFESPYGVVIRIRIFQLINCIIIKKNEYLLTFFAKL